MITLVLPFGTEQYTKTWKVQKKFTQPIGVGITDEYIVYGKVYQNTRTFTRSGIDNSNRLYSETFVQLSLTEYPWEQDVVKRITELEALGWEKHKE